MGLPMTLQGLNYTNRGRISSAHHLDPTLTILDAGNQCAAQPALSNQVTISYTWLLRT